MPRFIPRPSGLAPVSGQNGVHSKAIQKSHKPISLSPILQSPATVDEGFRDCDRTEQDQRVRGRKVSRE